jgi:hypothetical protein
MEATRCKRLLIGGETLTQSSRPRCRYERSTHQPGVSFGMRDRTRERLRDIPRQDCWRQHTACPDNPVTEHSPVVDPRLEVVTPRNSQIIFIDHQPRKALAVRPLDRQVLKNNTLVLTPLFERRAYKAPVLHGHLSLCPNPTAREFRLRDRHRYPLAAEYA